MYVLILFFAESCIICSLFEHSVHNNYFNLEYRCVLFLMYVGMLVMSLGSHIEAVLHISDLRHIYFRVQGQSQSVLQMYKCELKIHCKKG